MKKLIGELIGKHVVNLKKVPKIFYKPLTVNQAWEGRRFKTGAYKIFERDMLFLLPKIEAVKSPYSVSITFGFSNPGSDIDNPCKLLIDVLQKKYDINDKDIYELHVYKQITAKGKEYIDFKIETI